MRFCTQRYEAPAAANLGSVYCHLTNYAINKTSPCFEFNECVGGLGAVPACRGLSGVLGGGRRGEGGLMPAPLPVASPRRDAQQSGTGSKWLLSAWADYMRGQGHDFDALWGKVGLPLGGASH